MPTWLRTIVARILAAWRTDALDRDFEQEMEAHLAMATADKVRGGMTPTAARRAARLELGGMPQLRETARAARGLPWLGTFWLDVKLGLRMLRKSWGLTVVGGLAMTVVIAIGALTFSVMRAELGSVLPLDEGERIVALMVQDPTTTRRHEPSHPDFERWRRSLRRVESIGAFRTLERNLTADADTAGEPVSIAVMTASGFDAARVPPLLGRTLVAEDERPGAAPVVVIGHDVWESRFSSDPAAIGERLRLGGTEHTVVGVMPEGFAFPVNHRFWTALTQTAPVDATDDDDPGVFAFARLAPGISAAGAEAELTAVGLLPTSDTTEPRVERRPRVVPYTVALTVDNEEEEYFARLSVFLIVLLLVPPCANIAILVYAKTVTRQEEFAARYALGASRGRLVGQLFIEALVLAGGASALALVLLRLFYALEPFSGPNEPFWKDYGVSLSTVAVAGALAAVGAVITGVVPALQVTRALGASGMRALGGRTSLRLGAAWTAMVVAQIGFSIAVLPSAVEYGWSLTRAGVLGPGFAAEQYLTVRVMMDPEDTPGDSRDEAGRVGASHAELTRRLVAEPGVAALTLSAAAAGVERWAFVALDPTGAPRPAGALTTAHLSNVQVDVNTVDETFFDAYDMPAVGGRPFETADFVGNGTAVVINRVFARDIAGNGNPLGRRLRYVRRWDDQEAALEQWFEIVGVVDSRPANSDRRKIYHPLVPGTLQPVTLSVQMRPAASLPDRFASLSRQWTRACASTRSCAWTRSIAGSSSATTSRPLVSRW